MGDVAEQEVEAVGVGERAAEGGPAKVGVGAEAARVGLAGVEGAQAGGGCGVEGLALGVGDGGGLAHRGDRVAVGSRAGRTTGQLGRAQRRGCVNGISRRMVEASPEPHNVVGWGSAMGATRRY